MIGRRIISALVDREAIAWREASRLADTPRERRLVQDLRWLESASSTVADDRHRTPRLRLSRWGRMATAWAQFQVVLGLAMLAFGAAHDARLVVAQVLLVLSFWAASLMLLAGGTGDIRARWLALVYALTAAAFAHAFLGSTAWTLGFVRHTSIEALIPAAVWRFAQGFPRTERLTRFDRFVNLVCMGLLIVGVMLITANLLLLAIPALAGTPVALLDRDDRRWYFWAVVYPLALPGLLVPLLRAAAASREERGRVWLFTATLACGMTPILAFGLVEQFAPGAAALWTRSAAGRLLVDRLVLGALLLVPPATTYAILSRHALTLRFVLERATRHLLARSSLVMLTGVPASLLSLYLFERRAESLAAILAGPRGRAMAIWLGLSIAALAMRRQLLVMVDRAFSLGPVDHGRALAGAIAELRSAAGVAPVLGALADHVSRVFGSATAILRLDPAGDAQLLYGRAEVLGGRSAVMAILRDSKQPVIVHGPGSILELLPPTDRDWARAHSVELVCPLNRPDGQLIALLTVGARRDGFPWSERDLNWLTALADAAAIALDSAFREITRDGGVTDDWHSSECRDCGAVQAEPGASCACGGDLQPSLLPPVLHGKFAVERQIGRGGMGVVYRGRDLALDRVVALKTLPSLDAEAGVRMRAEARTMGALVHPSVATIFAVEQWQRMPVLVIELLEGGTLAERLRRGGPLPPNEAVSVCAVLARALGALHAVHLVHGDVKPSNIGFTSSGAAKLLDFGIAAVIGKQTLETGVRAGTPQYLPPEAYDFGMLSPAFDLWALSVVLFEMLSGVNPFAAPTLAGVKQKVCSRASFDVRTWRAGVPDRLNNALMRCLQPDPALRPPTADAWLAACTATE